MTELSTRDAAKFLGYEPQTLRRWRMEGIGPEYTKLSSRGFRYSLEDLQRYKEAGRVIPTRPEASIAALQD